LEAGGWGARAPVPAPAPAAGAEGGDRDEDDADTDIPEDEVQNDMAVVGPAPPVVPCPNPASTPLRPRHAQQGL